jgi:hypothetical protein
MIELLRLLTDVLFKAIPSISKTRQRKKWTSLGMQAFVVYLRLQECLTSAIHIAIVAQDIVDNPSNVSHRVEILAERLQAQIINLDRLARAITELHWLLSGLDSDLRPELDRMVSGKSVLLGHLAVTIETQRRLDMKTQVRKRLEGEAGRPATFDIQRCYQTIKDIDSINPGKAANAKKVRIVSAYLSGQPHERIEEIRRISQKMHKILVENFSLADILPALEKELAERPLD